MERQYEEVDAMSTATVLRKEEYQFAEDMERYVDSLKQQHLNAADEAYTEARDALKRTGVITAKGTTKKKIVSWE